MKNTFFNKVLFTIFYILCFFAFFFLVADSPKLFNELLNTDVFTGKSIIFFWAYIALLGYVFTYWDYNNNEKKREYDNKILELQNKITLLETEKSSNENMETNK